MYHIKGWKHYISNSRYSDMKYIVYENILFADIFLIFTQVIVDQLETHINQTPYLALALIIAWYAIDISYHWIYLLHPRL